MTLTSRSGRTSEAHVESHLHPEGSSTIADHPVPTGREEIWRFTPLKRLRGLHSDAPLDGSRRRAPSTTRPKLVRPRAARGGQPPARVERLRARPTGSPRGSGTRAASGSRYDRPGRDRGRPSGVRHPDRHRRRARDGHPRRDHRRRPQPGHRRGALRRLGHAGRQRRDRGRRRRRPDRGQHRRLGRRRRARRAPARPGRTRRALQARRRHLRRRASFATTPPPSTPGPAATSRCSASTSPTPASTSSTGCSSTTPPRRPRAT